MTRNNPREPLYAFDPEIERTQGRLRRGIRVLMGDHISQNPVEGQDPSAPVIRQQPPAPAGGLLHPPPQQNNQQQPAKTVKDHLAEDLDGLNPAVTIPEFEAEHFELKPMMFNMLNTFGQFGGSHVKNARQHLKSFLEICNSFKIHGVSNDILKLKLFPYSLRDKAKEWLNNLPPGSFQSYTELCRSFLAEFNYNNMTGNLRNQITSFRQEDDEAMQKAWERYRDLFRRCPMHGLPEWTQVSIFYNSVNTPTRMIIDASANGTLLDKPPRESLEIFEKLAQNDYQHPTTHRGTMRRGTAQLDSSNTILAQISTLTNMVKNLQKQPTILEVKNRDEDAKPRSCTQIFRKPSWTDIQVLKSRPLGGFPSDTKVAKGATHEQCKAISTRSGKVLKTPTENKQGETIVANSKALENTDNPASADIPVMAGKDRNIVTPRF
ncbi:hypothetical protein V6N13_004995 [Hibiscus sabdariffa]